MDNGGGKKRSYSVFGLLLTLSGAALGGFILASSHDWFALDAALKQAGAVASAEVVSLSCAAQSNAGGAAYGGEPEFIPRCEATYRFIGEDGQVQQSTKTVNQWLYARLEAGGYAPVTYLPENAEINEIEPGATAAMGWRLVTIGTTLFGLFGALFCYQLWRTLRTG